MIANKEILGVKDYKVKWESFHQDTRALAWKIHETNKKFKGIIAVTRGGLIPAGVLSRELDLFHIETIAVSLYEGQQIKDVGKITKYPAIKGDGEGWLVVDDLVDTGKTFKAVRQVLPKATYVTVYSKPKGVCEVDISIIQISQNTWIFFPWEWEEVKSPVGSLQTHLV